MSNNKIKILLQLDWALFSLLLETLILVIITVINYLKKSITPGLWFVFV